MKKPLVMTTAVLLAGFVFTIITGIILQRNQDEDAKQACATEIYRVTSAASNAEQASAFIASDPMVRAACNKLHPGMIP